MFDTSEAQCDTAMRYVLCQTNGGPHDDEAFMSGWRLGDIAATLALPGIHSLSDSIHPRERDQAELIAMARGYRMTIDASDHPEWLSVTFNRDPGYEG